MGKRTDGDVQKPIEHIEQIRDIIFGTQRREYDALFKKIDSDLSLLRESFQKQILEIRETFASELATSVRALEKKLTFLNSAVHEESAAFKKQLDLLDSKFDTRITTTAQETVDSITMIQKDLTEGRAQFQQEVRSLKELVLRELETKMGNLEEKKVSKEALAEVFFEVGMKVKDVDIAAGLQQAAKTKKGN